jgi:hypothetical protein
MMEGHMTENAVLKVSAEVKALRIVLITLLILYGAVFIGSISFLASAFPSFVHGTFGAAFWAEFRALLDKVLTGPIYFFIAYCIFKLIALVSRGEPFSPESPRHIRRIAYSVFGLGLISIITTMIVDLTQPGARVTDAVVRVLYGGLGTALLGFGFLVIARVLKVGVRLQQDQNLTV